MINYKKHRRNIEKLYEGKCTVKVWEPVTDPITKITKHMEVTIFEDQPCRLSYSSTLAANENEGPTNVEQFIKLFITPELEIPAGCKIIVTQNGRTTEYARGGEPAAYPTHQEITLKLFEGYA